MKKSLLITAVLFLANTAFGQRVCTTTAIKGDFALSVNGTVLGSTPISGPFMRLGSMVMDGNGGADVTTLALYNGINFGLEHYSGTYTVTSDCAIDFHFFLPNPVNLESEFKGEIAANGTDIVFMLLGAGVPNTVVAFANKRTVANCSAEDVQGSWRFEINGFRNLPPFGTGTAYRQVGQIRADRSGGMVGSFITNNAGVIAPETGTGTYSVATDCTFDLNYSIGGSPYSVRGSLLGKSKAYIGLNMPGPTVTGVGVLTGAVATGTMVRQPLGE
jgi:hypothetical protein